MTGFFEPSQLIAVVLRNLSGAIGGFQGASETSEENEMWQEPPIKPDFSGRDVSLTSQQLRGEVTPKIPLRPHVPPVTVVSMYRVISDVLVMCSVIKFRDIENYRR